MPRPLIWLLPLCAQPVLAQSLFAPLAGGIAGHAVTCAYNDTIDNVLYLGGPFHLADGSIESSGIVRWDGQEYTAVGCGVAWNCTTPFPGPWGGPLVYAITRWNDRLYVAGSFAMAGDSAVDNIAWFDGVNWHPLGGGTNGMVRDMQVLSDGLYVTGTFSVVDDTISAYGIAKYDGANWHSLGLPLLFPGSSTSNSVHCVAEFQGDLYIGGSFSDALGGGRRDIARFNGTDWVDVDGGLIGTYSWVSDLIVIGDKLYVLGGFSDVPPYGVASNPGSGIVAWDGVNWHHLLGGNGGSQVNSVLDGIAIRDTLYVLGYFDRIGGVPTGGLARWDEAQWCSMVPVDYFYPDKNCLVEYGGALHVGGSFTVAGPDSIDNIGKWIGGSYADSCGFAVSVPEITASTSTLYYDPTTHTLIPTHTNNAHLTLFDPLGRAVLARPLQGPVSVAALPPGVYVAVVGDVAGNRREVLRFVSE